MVSTEISHDKPGVVTAFRVLLTFLVVGVVVAILLYIMRGENSYDTGRVSKRYENLNKLNAESAKKAGEYGVVDLAKGVYQLPIQQAIVLTARDLATVAPHAAYAIATPTPAAPAPAAPSPAPATPVAPAPATPLPPAAPVTPAALP